MCQNILHNILHIKALTKQEGPNFCWNVRFFPCPYVNQLPAAKKNTQASQQKPSPSYFVTGLGCHKVSKILVLFLEMGVCIIISVQECKTLA